MQTHKTAGIKHALLYSSVCVQGREQDWENVPTEGNHDGISLCCQHLCCFTSVKKCLKSQQKDFTKHIKTTSGIISVHTRPPPYWRNETTRKPGACASSRSQCASVGGLDSLFPLERLVAFLSRQHYSCFCATTWSITSKMPQVRSCLNDGDIVTCCIMVAVLSCPSYPYFSPPPQHFWHLVPTDIMFSGSKFKDFMFFSWVAYRRSQWNISLMWFMVLVRYYCDRRQRHKTEDSSMGWTLSV